MVVNILVINAGSGSLKLNLLDAHDRRIAGTDIDAAPDGPEAREALRAFLDQTPNLDAVGHRFVHGGPELTASCRIDERVRRALEEACALAPLHLPPALFALDTVHRRLPDVPNIACLDTAFHAALPLAARTYAVPAEWRERHGIRRYGFHGLSYAWALQRAAELLARPIADLQVVLTHLGGGASVCAVSAGQSVSTSMGFTPLEGLVMVRRSGSVDPGMLLWLQTSRGLSAQDISDALEHRSGLLGLSGGRSGDTRELVKAAASGDDQAQLAMDVYTLRIRQEVAAAAASLPRAWTPSSSPERSAPTNPRSAKRSAPDSPCSASNPDSTDARTTTASSATPTPGSPSCSSIPERTARSPPKSARSSADRGPRRSATLYASIAASGIAAARRGQTATTRPAAHRGDHSEQPSRRRGGSAAQQHAGHARRRVAQRAAERVEAGDVRLAFGDDPHATGDRRSPRC